MDPQGKPWNPKKALVQWKDGQWIGDVPDGPAPPLAMQGGKLPFIMQPEGLGALYGPGLAEGPFPEHYEPMESPFEKNIMSAQRVNPALHSFGKDMNPIANASPDFPLVMTTYSCTEHWCTGAFTRWQPWLVEAQPQAYVEISEEAAHRISKRAKVGDIVSYKQFLYKLVEAKGHCQRGKGSHLLGARHGRRRGDGHGAPHALQVRRQNRASGGHDLQLRLAAAQGMRRHGKPAQSHGR